MQQSLFAQGYRVRVGHGEYELIVRKPDGTKYTVNAVADTCTCAAGENARNCKHRRQIAQLVSEQWAQILPGLTVAQTTRYESEMYRLMLTWERCQEAKQSITPQHYHRSQLAAA